MPDANDAPQEPKAPRCPICRRAASKDYRPFCSRRCADVDLSRWLSGAYVVAAVSADEDEDGDAGNAPPEPSAGRRDDGDDRTG